MAFDPWLEYALRVINGTYGDEVSVLEKKKNLLKFGQNESVGTSEATIMELAGSETEETYVSTNAIDSLVCTDASFTGDIRIEGHYVDGDGNYVFSVQTVTANGQTRVALDQNLARCTRINTADETTFSTPASDKVYVFQNGATTNGIPDTASEVHCIMSANERSSKKASTTISWRDYAIVTNVYADVNKKQSATVDIRLKIRENGSGQGRNPGGFRTNIVRSVSTTGSGGFVYEPKPYIIIPKSSDVLLSATASTTGVSVSAGFGSVLASVKGTD